MASTSTVRSSQQQQRSHIPHGHPPPSTTSSGANNTSATTSRNAGGGHGHGHGHGHSARSKTPSKASSRRSVTPNSRSLSIDADDLSEAGRVRVAVRLRPKNNEDLLSDADFTDCVELQPELKKLKLRKNNWSSEAYRFDEVLTESASQKRVYDVVAKPVVESVLSGYNGTVMAYGQTGTGKTYTLGRVGKDDASNRGIMVRALEDIIDSISPASDSVEISYLQIYMESVQDLLAPEKINIPIAEDPKNGEVSLPGATVVKIQNLDHFIQLLQIGEVNRHASNTKMNTESSRSHAILMVYFRRSVHEKEENVASFQGKDTRSGNHLIPTIRKSKLLIVDLAGSERLDKSGSEGHMAEETKFINLSLSSLGKCINALAENSPHIPTRDSKLTRLLRDSFGGSARTSLIITIGPSSRHQAETTSTIMFGQRAMKVVNMVKLKEEFDYESHCRKLANQVEHLTAEVDRQQKLRNTDKYELEKNVRECQNSFSEVEKTLKARLEFLKKENTRLESEMKDLLKELHQLEDRNGQLCSEVERLEISIKKSKLLEKENFRLESEMKDLFKELYNQKDQNTLMHDEVARLQMDLEHSKQYQVENSTYQKVLAETTQMYENKVAELMMQLDEERAGSKSAEEQLDLMKKLLSDQQRSNQQHQIEHSTYQEALADTTQMYEEKIGELLKQLEEERMHSEDSRKELASAKKLLHDHQTSAQIGGQQEIDGLRVKLQEVSKLHQTAFDELQSLKSEYKDVLSEKAKLKDELHVVRETFLVEEKRRKAVESELVNLMKVVPESEDNFEDKRSYMKENIGRGSAKFGTQLSRHNSSQLRQTNSFQRTTIAKICEEVGLEKILALLASGDLDVQIHAVKVVANLAAEDINQERIVEEGGLDALLMLLRTTQNTTILRVASGAIANLAMNEINQGLIMSKQGAYLLAETASKTEDSQTLRMVAGAIANLCGNEKLHLRLSEEGGIRALLGMVRSGNADVIAQVARGIANFAKCESRAITQGHRRGRSLLVDDGVLTWLLSNCNTTSVSTRRHIELALCHLAQNDNNTRDFITSGGAKELARISTESSREDIRNLAKKILKMNRTFQAEGYVSQS